jgi:hypothetical protein
LQRIKEAYLIWIDVSVHIPKNARYAIGARIENKYLDLLECARIAYFINKETAEEKIRKISECILILDSLKFLVSLSWEAKFISNRRCEEIALKLDEIGKMLNGWKNSLDNPEKKNRTFG